jgi:large subunit ribosomal protein L3
MTGLWGKKIGMTQVFAENKVVPVTVINTAHWFITNTRTVEKDGYDAVQVGCVRPKYQEQEFSLDWIKQPKKYFSFIREIKLNKDITLELEVGKPASFLNVIQQGDMVDVHGTSKGRGFAGVVKRHGFAGPPASHGSKMGKRPGSISFMRSQGRVPKGKRMPGHLGDDSKVIRNLEIITIKPNDNVVLLKGSVPGKAGSLIFLQKA